MVAGGAQRPTSAAALRSPRNEIPRPFSRIERVIIEICCGKDSRIGQKTKHSEGCLIIRVTIDDDFGTDDGVNKILLALEQYMCYPILVWVSIPCTGGTQWTYYNWAYGGSKTRALIASHVRLFHKLFESLERILPSISDVGGKVAIEWPKSCKYWKFPRVKALCLSAKLQTVCFDGCAFGVKSVAPSTKGLPIKKPWRVDTDMPELLETLNRKCSCVIPHTPCAGSDTRLTESYTDDMAAAIHIGFS